MIPILQKELDDFKNIVWNTHRIRKQKGVYIPDGIPDHVYSFPERYNLKNCGKKCKRQKMFIVNN